MSDMKGKFKKSISRDEMSSGSSTSSFSSDDSDGDGDLKPIKDYLSDRREVAKQLFKSVKIEKIRMMLPQVLKKMDLNELEEWCASELCGMSKSRILSILNGTPMSGSSDTSDSDGSGPSLEIISDTEEWLSDDDLGIKKEPLSPASRSKKPKSKRKTKSSSKDPEKIKNRKTKVRPQVPDISKVKKEKEKPEAPKEGESLLDLLELEMRARAIRALIRKEEDIIPDSALSNALKSTLTSVTNAKNKVGPTARGANEAQTSNVTSSTLIEKIGEDEDVVVLVKPTPTIEVISSESDFEDPPESNKKGISEKNQKDQKNQKGQTRKAVKAPSTTLNESEPTTSSESHKTRATIENRGPTDGLHLSSECAIEESVGPNESAEMKKQTFRKLKRKRQLRKRSESVAKCPEETQALEVNAKEKRCETPEEGEVDSSEEKAEEGKGEASVIDKKEITRDTLKTVPQSDNKSKEYDEIIDLDDYPDDMYNIEPDEHPTAIEGELPKLEKKEKGDEENLDRGSAETWATRYYQTDNVQNVIKESKIQSEIRKRLRERQRLSKLHNSPKETPKVNEDNDAKDKFKPTGSVDEYFALKGADTTGGSNLSPSEKCEAKNNDEGQVDEDKTLPEEEVKAPTSDVASAGKLSDEVNESAVLSVMEDKL